MLTRTRAIAAATTAALASLMVCACGGIAIGSFSCGTLECTSGTQYCLKQEATASYSCVDLPSSGCVSGTWCETCLMSVASEEVCSESMIGGVDDIEVDVDGS
jgi:hypothetical protein